ncbi:sugar-binding protein [Pseudoponticoccus marisrubri]|uniref:ABC transporter substrate-binding protein n=1 Tax=Pseudoponticoccus marisrubri TaxID=1685382 RepID=A0A0W7WFU4_9RHOB|nr:sugar-binding protein [Pseudoponticoccus marisrubri]KUF09342.1 ABC transporter substrate-binding protein [Pseudoponticoccus marisrubri]
MKKLLTATALVALTAPAAFAEAHGGYTFALVPKAMNNPFFDLARDGCYKAQEELEDVTCEYIGPGEHTELEQIQIVQDLITKGVDGIAVAPSNAPAMAKALEDAAEAGIPVMTWDSDLLPEDAELRTTYVGTFNYDIGRHLAELVQARHPDGGTICLQTGGAAAANHNERLLGAREQLAGMELGDPPGEPLTGQGGWTEISGCPLITNDDGNVAVQGMTDILAANPDLTAFLSTGAFTQWFDNAYRNAVEPYQEEMANGDLTIVVADTLPMQIAQTKDGLGNGLVGQRPFEMGYKAMYILKDIAEGNEVEDPIYTGLDVCNNDNIDTCVN